MKGFSFLFFTIIMMVSCYAQNNQIKPTTMDNKDKTNPVYSKTDTGKVALKDEEWKKILRPEVY